MSRLFLVYNVDTGKRFGYTQTLEEAEEFCQQVKRNSFNEISVTYEMIKLIDKNSAPDYCFNGEYISNFSLDFDSHFITGETCELETGMEETLNKLSMFKFGWTHHGRPFVTIQARTKTKQEFEELVRVHLKRLKEINFNRSLFPGVC